MTGAAGEATAAGETMTCDHKQLDEHGTCRICGVDCRVVAKEPRQMQVPKHSLYPNYADEPREER